MAMGGLFEAILLFLAVAVAAAVVANVIAALIGIWPARRRVKVGGKILIASFLGSLVTVVLGLAILLFAHPTHEYSEIYSLPALLAYPVGCAISFAVARRAESTHS